MLQTDNPYYAGRALYWFTEPILGLEHFTRIAEQSKRVLGQRYTPESHLDLPIANTFDGIGFFLYDFDSEMDKLYKLVYGWTTRALSHLPRLEL